MTKRDEPNPDVEALRERSARLSGAILRISASLDVDTVLREVVDSARALTGARYGVIATIDEVGRPLGHVASGLTPEEAREMAAWPDAMRLFAHLRSLDGPLRLADLGDYVRSLGFAPGLIPCRTFQGTPIRHRGLDVGNFFLGEKAGGAEFTDDDEEVLVLLAAQAAIAISNARAHRDEQRAAGLLRSPGRDFAGRCRGVRRAERDTGEPQPRGAAHRRGAAHAGRHGGRLARSAHLAPVPPAASSSRSGPHPLSSPPISRSCAACRTRSTVPCSSQHFPVELECEQRSVVAAELDRRWRDGLVGERESGALATL